MASEKHPRYLHSSQVIKRYSLRSYSSQEQSLQIVKFKEEQRDKIQGDLEKARKRFDTLIMKLEELNQKLAQKQISQLDLRHGLQSLQIKIGNASDEYEKGMLRAEVRKIQRKIEIEVMIQKRVLEQIQGTKEAIQREEESIREIEWYLKKQEERLDELRKKTMKLESSPVFFPPIGKRKVEQRMPKRM